MGRGRADRRLRDEIHDPPAGGALALPALSQVVDQSRVTECHLPKGRRSHARGLEKVLHISQDGVDLWFGFHADLYNRKFPAHQQERTYWINPIFIGHNPLMPDGNAAREYLKTALATAGVTM